jgi:hypothetical protein
MVKIPHSKSPWSNWMVSTIFLGHSPLVCILRVKEKMGYLNGKIQEPKPNDPTYDKWEAQSSTIMSWLLHSMQLEIS